MFSHSLHRRLLDPDQHPDQHQDKAIEKDLYLAKDSDLEKDQDLAKDSDPDQVKDLVKPIVLACFRNCFFHPSTVNYVLSQDLDQHLDHHPDPNLEWDHLDKGIDPYLDLDLVQIINPDLDADIGSALFRIRLIDCSKTNT